MKITKKNMFLFFSCILMGLEVIFISIPINKKVPPEIIPTEEEIKIQDVLWNIKNQNMPYQGDTVSFCITYRDRFWQISKTLPKNLADNRQDKDFVEFILIDFDPKDTTLKDFIFKNFENDLKSGYLKYYQTDKMLSWNMSIAKNTAHYYANNKIVVNLDCDNYTGFRGGLYVARLISPGTILWQASLNNKNGTYGRIALYKKDFDELGGYDENLPEPVGTQDSDLLNRGTLVLTRIRKYGHSKAIINSIEDKLKYINTIKSFSEMDDLNEIYSKKNLKNHKYKANNGIYGIRNGVIRIMPKEY